MTENSNCDKVNQDKKPKHEVIKQWQKKMLSVVELYLESTATEEQLKEDCQILTQQDYDDITTERSILKLCGYPLCDKNLCSAKDSRQKFKISTKTNRVYEITERKMFCSNTCYESSTHLKSQLFTEAIWFRAEEFREINFYSGRGKPGEVVPLDTKLNPLEILTESDGISNSERQPNTRPKSILKKSQIGSPYIKEEDFDKLKTHMEKLTIYEKVLKG